MKKLLVLFFVAYIIASSFGDTETTTETKNDEECEEGTSFGTLCKYCECKDKKIVCKRMENCTVPHQSVVTMHGCLGGYVYTDHCEECTCVDDKPVCKPEGCATKEYKGD